ncbi:MAG: chemotaxis protein CheX [Terriglobia bacterium]|jgi:CheY-specific phosphatase CheX
MTITSDDLCKFTRAIWESTLGLEVQPTAGLTPAEERACTLIGRVQITGTRQRTVSLKCTQELAGRVARAMFGLDSQKPTPDEMRDAWAEITNVTAGNLKSLGCGHCQLSTPQVAEREQDLPETPQSSVLARQAFVCEGEPFVVKLFEG